MKIVDADYRAHRWTVKAVQLICIAIKSSCSHLRRIPSLMSWVLSVLQFDELTHFLVANRCIDRF